MMLRIMTIATLTPLLLGSASLNVASAEGAKSNRGLSPIPAIAHRQGSEIAGRWEWTLDLGPASGKVVLDVTDDGNGLSAVLTTPDGTKLKPKHFSLKDNKLKMIVERKKGFLTISLTHQGQLKGDTIQGTFRASGGPINKSGKWLAKRVPNSQQEGSMR